MHWTNQRSPKKKISPTTQTEALPLQEKTVVALIWLKMQSAILARECHGFTTDRRHTSVLQFVKICLKLFPGGSEGEASVNMSSWSLDSVRVALRRCSRQRRRLLPADRWQTQLTKVLVDEWETGEFRLVDCHNYRWIRRGQVRFLGREILVKVAGIRAGFLQGTAQKLSQAQGYF